MDISTLSKAYSALIGAALALPQANSLYGDEFTLADWILAHLVLNDRLLLRTAGQVLARTPAEFHNASLVSADEIGTLICAYDRPALIELVRFTAARLLDTVARIPDAEADHLVRVRLVNRRGAEVFADCLVWRHLIDLRAREQIPAHTVQLERLRVADLRP